MSGNRRRHANAIPLATFATWAAIGIFICVAGLFYVWGKNQLYSTGTEIKTLERDLIDLKKKNEVTLIKISQLSSTAKVQERYNAGFINLIPITNERIATIANKSSAPSADELRAISNERKGK